MIVFSLRQTSLYIKGNDFSHTNISFIDMYKVRKLVVIFLHNSYYHNERSKENRCTIYQYIITDLMLSSIDTYKNRWIWKLGRKHKKYFIKLLMIFKSYITLHYTNFCSFALYIHWKNPFADFARIPITRSSNNNGIGFVKQY